jgi:hypothetical protein
MAEPKAKPLRCRLGRHEWRLRKGRLDASEAEEGTYHWCQVCGKTRTKPPRGPWGRLPGIGPDAYTGTGG